MAMYLRFGGIDGDATLQSYDDWINIFQFDWTISWPITTRAGVKSGTRGGNNPKVGEITVKKYADSTSTKMVTAICKSNTPRMCAVHFVRTDTGGTCFLEYRFYEALITHWSMSATDAGNSRPTEEIHINFTAFDMSFMPADEENVTATMLRADHYDLIDGKA